MRIDWRPSPRAFELDIRAIGLFRIALGIVVLADQLIRMQNWGALIGPSGFASKEFTQELEGIWLWSVYWLSDSPVLPYVVEVIRMVATVLLILGIRSRAMALVLFVIVSSVINHNLMPFQGGDRVMSVMLFFSVFLPLGGRYSIEALWHGPDEKRTFRSFGSAAYAIQVVLVFFASGMLKLDPAWLSNFTAVSMAVHIEIFATEIARLWRHIDVIGQVLTFIVIWTELLAPGIALLPGIWARSIGVGALLMLEAGIWLSLEIGLFPFISVISLIPLFPGVWLDLVLKRRTLRGEEWTFFYDKNCRFCLFTCRLLKAICGVHQAKIEQAQEDPTAAQILREDGSWSVQRQEEDEYSAGWTAVRRLLEESGRRWITARLPEGERGTVWYRWIGQRRGRFSEIGNAVCGRQRWKNPGKVGETVAAVTISAVVVWNIVIHPEVMKREDLVKHLHPWVSSLNLNQHWNMFAPVPYYNDWWLIGMGLDWKGGILNLWSGETMPEELRPPVDGGKYYGSYRLRKSLHLAHRFDKMEDMLGYYCNTGKWQGLAIWTVWRRNLGTSATTSQPYLKEREWWWKCDGSNEQAVQEFYDEVLYRMEMGIELEEPMRGLE